MKLNVAILAAVAAICCLSSFSEALGTQQARPAVLPIARPARLVSRQQETSGLTKIEKDALDELLALIHEGLQALLQLVSDDFDETLVIIQGFVTMLNELQAQGVDLQQFVFDLLMETLGSLIGFPIKSWDDWDAILSIIQMGLEGLVDLAGGDLELALAVVQELIADVQLLQEQNPEAWQQQLIDMALAALDALLAEVESLIEGNPKIRAILRNRNALDDLLVLIQEGLDGILNLVEGNLQDALVFVQDMLDMLLELQAQSAEDWEQQLIDLALQSLGTILGQIEEMLGISPFNAKHGRPVQVFKVMDKRNVQKVFQLRLAADKSVQEGIKAVAHKIEKDALDDLLALLTQGLDGILNLVEGNLEDALAFVQNMLDMLLELQAQSGEDWEQQLINMALQSLGTILGQIEDLLGITPRSFKRLAASHAKLSRDALDDLLVLIQEGLDGILNLVEGNLDEALIFVQNMLDMLLELQAQSGEDWEQQLIDLALQSLGTILGQIEDLLGIGTQRKLQQMVVSHAQLSKDALEDLLVLIQEGLDGILNLVEGNLEEALVFVQNMLDMLLELQAQSGEDWEQQLIDLALQSLGTILGQIEDLLGIGAPRKLKQIAVSHAKLSKDALDDLLVLIQEGLDGILNLVEGNLEEALIFVQNMLDMLLELQAQSGEDWEQQLIDLALQSLGTILGQIEDLLGISP